MSNGLQVGRENDAYNKTKSQLQNLKEHFCKVIFALDPVIIPVSQPIFFRAQPCLFLHYNSALNHFTTFHFSLHTDFTRKNLFTF